MYIHAQVLCEINCCERMINVLKKMYCGLPSQLHKYSITRRWRHYPHKSSTPTDSISDTVSDTDSSKINLED